MRLYTPLSNLGPAQLESRASHECAEALPVRDPAGPTPTHRHGPTISHKAATSSSSMPSPSHPQPSLPVTPPRDLMPAAFISCGGAPPCLVCRERISSIVPLVVAVTVDGAASRSGRAGVNALASTGVGRARLALCSCVASTCLRPCCLRTVSRSGRAQAGLIGRQVCTRAPEQWQ